jgi:tRNA (cmo5U34)-methyltransferase
MLELLKIKGCQRTSLAVQKDNYAVKMYRKVGFTLLKELEQEYLMVCDLQNTLVEMTDFFNHRAPIYDEKHLEHIGGMESKTVLVSFFSPFNKTMIDLGIGTGLELEAIFKRFPDIEVTGLDISKDMLKLLDQKYQGKKIHLYCESYLHFDFGCGLYDVALSVMSLHHYNHQTKTNLYRKINNCLNNNGVYIECDYMLSEHAYENPQKQEDFYFSELERLKREQEITDNRTYHFDTPCTVSNQKKMLLEAGFSNVKEVWNNKNVVILLAEK